MLSGNGQPGPSGFSPSQQAQSIGPVDSNGRKYKVKGVVRRKGEKNWRNWGIHVSNPPKDGGLKFYTWHDLPPLGYKEGKN